MSETQFDYLSTYPCGICGKPSVEVFQNLKEIAPTEPDKDGVRWARWEIIDGMHYRCKDHMGLGKKASERLTKEERQALGLP